MNTPLGLATPWVWVQPRTTDELLARLHDAFDLAVHERERENLCSCAFIEIKRLVAENRDLRLELHVAVNECCNDYWNKGHGQRVEEKYGIKLDDEDAA